MLKKTFNLELKEFDGDGGFFEGYGSTFGNLDRAGDIVESGAFEKSLTEHKSQGSAPAMLLHHDMSRPVGKWTELREDGDGLHVKGKLSLGVRDADEAYTLLKDGVINSLSIGYVVEKEKYNHTTRTNHLKEINLHEISLVTIPANAQAMIGSVKSSDGVPNIRSLEMVLREAGLSRRESKAVLAEGFKALDSEQDVLQGLFNDAVEAAVKARLHDESRLAQINNRLKEFK